ncbi:MAG: penicillin-binding protein 2 [Chloroflexi bacterium]|nr:penicillin-binding protein 2 [Chloroflexota bacterium]MCI0578440.1 penicillin-binding protein 2 [Chloroflexota bacterium]MCI0643886.1 penicillin-binding protein 2 [Chloroflexota bacterium]MCI0729204.1 penicillin-binding protein 2 [Chloroflexota bacterium]
MSRVGWERIEEQEQPEEDSGIRGRLYFLRLLVVAALGLLIYRVYWLQQTRGQEFQTLAEDNQVARLLIDSPRGVIFDRNGQPLAVNVPSFNVTITPAFLPTDPAERQAVFERLSFLTGVPVTTTIQQQDLLDAADPALVSTYSRLAELYGAPVAETLDVTGIVARLPASIEGIYKEYSFAQYLPAPIKTGIPITLAYTIEQESIFLPGVQVIEEPLRYYPSGEYTAHIIGYMGPIPNENWLQLGYQRDDRVGWAGLESSMEIELAGQKGERQIEQDWTGRELRQIGPTKEPAAGQNLWLTLDLDLQVKTHEILTKWMDIRRQTLDPFTRQPVETELGVVVALNPNTGEVLAMVSIPTFDNNRFATEVPVDYYLGLARNDYAPLFNHAISDEYPPGSTFKLVPASAALQEGVVSPNRFLFDPGQITIPNRFAPNDPGRAQTFVCWYQPGHEFMNMFSGISNSCDVYFYKISGGFNQDGEVVEGLGVDRMHEYAAQFGFGRVQGIELPLEADGNNPTQAWKRQTQGEPWSTGDDYNMGIGQGFMLATPLQVAQMAAVVANGGFLYRPTIIHHITDENGDTIRPFEPEVLNSVNVDRQWLDVVAEGMRLVNQEGGTGTSYTTWLDEYGITSAGKTGTSEFCDNIAIERRWCKAGEILPTHSWYVGYAPFESPEIVVVAFMYNAGEGSEWAARVVREVMTAYFQVGDYAPVEEAPAGEPTEEPGPEQPEDVSQAPSFLVYALGVIVLSSLHGVRPAHPSWAKRLGQEKAVGRVDAGCSPERRRSKSG